MYNNLISFDLISIYEFVYFFSLIDDHEFFPVVAPLKGMEHCIGTFVESCDVNNDGAISKVEWVTCLQLDADDVTNIDLRCDEFHE